MEFQIVTHFQPAGDQPQAIDNLVAGLNSNKRDQVLLGVTGSGKLYYGKCYCKNKQACVNYGT